MGVPRSASAVPGLVLSALLALSATGFMGAAHAQAPAPKWADVQTVGGVPSLVPGASAIAPRPAGRAATDPAVALATCNYLAPLAGQVTPMPTSGYLTTILGSRVGSTWMVTAVSAAFGEDWDLELFRSTAPSPDCVTSLLASSVYGGAAVDFVLGDASVQPHADVYARHSRYSGTGVGRAQWCNSTGTLLVNDFELTSRCGADSLVEVWAVQLTAGVSYTLGFSPGSLPGATLHVFRNPSSGAYWAPRAAALATFSGTGEFTAPATGMYALVVANDGHATGEYSISVGTCTPTTLFGGSVGFMPRRQAVWGFSVPAQQWAVFAAERGDLEMYSALSGGYPQCASGLLAGNTSVSSAPSFVVGNFNAMPAAYVYARTEVPSAGPTVGVMWDGGPDLLVADGPPVRRAFDGGRRQFAEAWDIQLEAGQTYLFYQDGQGTSYDVYVFADTGTGSHWFTPSAAVASGAQPFTYTATSTGKHGVVVISSAFQNGGHYTLGVSKAPCANPAKLFARTPTPLTAPDQWFRLSPVTSAWEAFAVRGGDASDDWDISLSADPTGRAAPACIGAPLAQSAQGAGLVDVIALQMGSTPLDYHFVHAHHSSATGTAGVAEFDSTRGTLVINDPLADVAMSATTLVHSYSVGLFAGAPYTIDFVPGAPGQRLLLFQNPGTSRRVVGRAGALASIDTSYDFVPTTSGLYGLVVVNDAGVAGNYQLRVRSCLSMAVTLPPGAAHPPASAVSFYRLLPTQSRWSAVGVRSGTSDWDISVSDSVGAQFQDCIGPAIATSASQPSGRTDFLVGDFHHAPLVEQWVRAWQVTTGALRPAYVEWSPATTSLTVNAGIETPVATSLTLPLNTFDARLEAGKTYTIGFTHVGDCNLHLLLFRNPGEGVWWAGRSSALLDIPVATGTTLYTPTVTDDYAIVVVNDDGRNDSFLVSLGLCSAPVPLASNAPVEVQPTSFFSFVPAPDDWAALGVYGSSNWNIELYRQGSGGAPGVCLADLITSATNSGQVDFLLGDFHAGANAPGTFYARAYEYPAVGQPGSVEFATASGELVPMAGAVSGSLGRADVLSVWNVELEADRDYQLSFTHYFRSGIRALLFRNPGGAYWVPRGARLWETTGHMTWRSGAAGRHALVVVNDNGVQGDYSLALSYPGVAVEGDGAPARSSLDAVSPNPARGALSVSFALHAPAMVKLELLDLSGRRVATLEEGARDAGRFSVAWSGAAPPGLYCLRLQAGGRTVGEKKVVLVR